jgi:DNA ligase-1
MHSFAALLETLVLTPSRNRKLEALEAYFRSTPDPDRGYALASLTGELTLHQVKPYVLKAMVLEQVDPVLFGISHDYVGDLAETISLIWPHRREGALPGVADTIGLMENTPKKDLPALLFDLLSRGNHTDRWALIKLVTGGLRVGVSARLARTALAHYGNVDLQEIERVWHGVPVPYEPLFAWLDGKAEAPAIHRNHTFHPMMLSHPIDEAKDFDLIQPDDYQVEWKWDGIRVQLVFDESNRCMFSRTGDNISATFPDIVESLQGSAVMDGELLVGKNFEAGAFNDLQQRLNRKTVLKKHLEDFPGFIRLYDMLFDGDEDIRDLPLRDRRARLERWLVANPQTRLDLSPIIVFTSWQELGDIRARGAEEHGHEGVMIKHKDSPYIAGRPKGYWYKWKRDPRLLDAVLMYAQRGHGKRSSFYSDYTFGVWKGNEIVPIGKAYFGFTDEELKLLDKWIRNNTVEQYGPVREVKKELVFEVAFDSAHNSPRHKSGVALRFPRINRIRWDKPAQQADTLEGALKFVS